MWADLLQQFVPMLMNQNGGINPFLPKMMGGGGQTVFGQDGFPATMNPQSNPSYGDIMGKMGLMLAQNSQQKPQQMLPMQARTMGAPQPQQLGLPKNPSQPAPMGMAPLMGGQAVRSGPGAGVLSPQDIQQLMLLLQSGQRI